MITTVLQENPWLPVTHCDSRMPDPPTTSLMRKVVR